MSADDIDVADEPVHLSDDDNDTDLAPLVAMLPAKKRNGSCLRDNDLSHKDDYDLEIIIPAYNVEQYIDQCLQSVINQRSKYKCLIVVINDGSTDDTRQHLANYEYCPDIEIIDQKNAGLAAARNAALRHIRGRYVTFVPASIPATPIPSRSTIVGPASCKATLVAKCCAQSCSRTSASPKAISLRTR